MAPLLSTLREPPVVGRYYMVPTVRYRLRGVVKDWPVIGPRHDDAADLNFPHLHYHLDGRFMTAAMHRAIESFGRDAETNLAGIVLVEPIGIEDDPSAQRIYGRLPKTPTLKKRKCVRASYLYTEKARELISRRNGGDRISAKYSGTPDAIRLRDGRLLCPHRKVDLSQFPPDENGVVACPLHGLRVRCRQTADAA